MTAQHVYSITVLTYLTHQICTLYIPRKQILLQECQLGCLEYSLFHSPIRNRKDYYVHYAMDNFTQLTSIRCSYGSLIWYFNNRNALKCA